MSEENAARQDAGCLKGMRVVDFTIALAGPSCCGHLADMGAEVIRVERPGNAAEGQGRVERPTHDRVNYVGALYAWRNGGKKCVAIDLKQPEGVQIFKDLVKASDVVVQNHKVGVMDRLGIGYEALREVNPGIVMCSISGFGQFGPLADHPAYDLLIQAMSGSAWIGGEPDRNPAPGWVSWTDTATGMHAFSAINAALYRRSKTGLGQHVEVSMLESAFTFHDYPLLEYLWSNGQIKRTRKGPFHPTAAMMGIFQCKDGYVAISATNDDRWQAIADLMERPELGTDPRYATRYARNEHMDEVHQLFQDWLKGFTAEDARVVLEENGIMVTNVLSIEEIVNHPQMQARGMITEIDDPRTGRARLPNTAFKYAGAKAEKRGRPPFQGEHNREVLLDLLAYSEERVDELTKKGILYADEAVYSFASD